MATFWLLFATAVGVLMAYKFGAPEFWPGAWLTFGRLRPIHTNDPFWGWASLALVGLAYYYVAARSSRTRLYSPRLAWIGLALFNLAAAAGTIALALGFNDGDLEYREWPWPIRRSCSWAWCTSRDFQFGWTRTQLTTADNRAG
jgi:cytochrome c oxidase cbb3-type subunit 1